MFVLKLFVFTHYIIIVAYVVTPVHVRVVILHHISNNMLMWNVKLIQCSLVCHDRIPNFGTIDLDGTYVV